MVQILKSVKQIPKKMRIKLLFVCILFSLLPHLLEAQYWRRRPFEIGFGIGGANLLGDLGGRSPGDGHRFIDFDVLLTRPSLTVFTKYTFADRWKAKLGLLGGYVSANDKHSGNESRKLRGLSVVTPFVELMPSVEWYILKNTRGRYYSMRGIRGAWKKKLAASVYGGLSIVYFDPRAKDNNGKYVRLAPLNTEGQGLPGGPDDYSQITIGLASGINVYYDITKKWTLGLDLGIKMLATDYFDDVSGRYYKDSQLFIAQYGEEAYLMSDKRPVGRKTEGGIRGNPDKNDAFWTVMFTISKRITMRPGSRTRF